MKLEDLAANILLMSHDQRAAFITDLRQVREVALLPPPPKEKKPKKAKKSSSQNGNMVSVTPEQLAALKELGLL